MPSAVSYTDLWTFHCKRCGSFDVWGKDWSETPPELRPRPYRTGYAVFEPEDVRATRCPGCRQPCYPFGPRESLT